MDTLQYNLNNYNNILIQYNHLYDRRTNENCTQDNITSNTLYSRLIDYGNNIKNLIQNIYNDNRNRIIQFQNTNQDQIIDNLISINEQLYNIYINFPEPEIPIDKCTNIDSYNDRNDDLSDEISNQNSRSYIDNIPILQTNILNSPNRDFYQMESTSITLNNLNEMIEAVNQTDEISKLRSELTNGQTNSVLESLKNNQTTQSQNNIINMQNQVETTPVTLNYINELVERTRQTGEIPQLRPGLTDNQRNSILQILESSRNNNITETFNMNIKKLLIVIISFIIMIIFIVYLLYNSE